MSAFDEEVEEVTGDPGSYKFGVFLTLELDELIADLSYSVSLDAESNQDARSKFIDYFNSNTLPQMIEDADDVAFLPNPQFGAEAAREQKQLIEQKLASGFDLSEASITGFEAEGYGPAHDEVLIEAHDIG